MKAMSVRKMKTIGAAKRITVELGFGGHRRAWDCRPFGFGRVVAPTLPTEIELQPGTHLDLRTGELRAAITSAAA